MRSLTSSVGALGAERHILGDPRSQRRHVLVRDSRKSVLVKAPCCLRGRAGASQREHGAMLEAHVVWILAQATLGEVERRQQLPAPLLIADGLEPPGGALGLGSAGGQRRGRRSHDSTLIRP